MFRVYFTVMLLLLAGSNAVVFFAASRAFGLSRRRRLMLGTALALGVGAMLGGRLARDAFSASVSRAFVTLTLIIELAILLAAALIIVATPVIWLATALRSRLAGEPSGNQDNDRAQSGSPDGERRTSPETTELSPPQPSRRDVLRQLSVGSALALGSGASVYGAIVGRRDYRVDEVPVSMPGLSRALDGFTIAQLSDIHFGLFGGEAEIRIAEELVARTKPDAIVLTGDLVDHDPRYAPLLGQLVRRLTPLAREGVIAVPGNHDYYTGIDVVIDVLRRAGARVLVNDGLVIGEPSQGLALLGVDDVMSSRFRRGGGPDLDAALRKVPGGLPRVLLSHNPVTFPSFAGRVGLQLSGHTHGGQVNVGPRLADYVLPHGYVAGLYERAGSRLYVNRGFGVAGPPARLGAPPELTKIVLTSS